MRTISHHIAGQIILVVFLFCLTGCDRQKDRSGPVATPVGPDALLYRITATSTMRAVETNAMVVVTGSFKDEDWKAILNLLGRIPSISLKVQRVEFFGSPRPVAVEVQLPRYLIYFVKPVYEEWKGAAVVVHNSGATRDE